MNRTLRRPMFRMGGTAEGLTSGLAPRQGYERGRVVNPGGYKGDPVDVALGHMQDPRIQEFIKGRRKPPGLSQFLIDFGLDIASRPPSGSIFSTAAAAAKDPFARYTGAKQAAAAQEYESESDMFKTLLEAGAIGDEKTYAHRDKASMIDTNMDQQYEIYDQINALDPGDVNYEADKEKLTRNLRKLKEQVSGEEFGKAQLQYWSKDENSRKLDRMIRMEIAKELGVDVDTTFEENKEFAEKFIKRRGELMKEIELGMSPTFNFATGGRVGYANAGAVMPGATPMNQAAGPTDQGPAPEDMAGITYEELRARLPQEVSDDIVRLLANSAEALEDFAMIQTEQDINTFNKKYGVTLVLPSEG